MTRPWPELAHLRAPGTEIALRVIPRARRTALEVLPGRLVARVTAPPADGRANAAAVELLAAALDLPKSHLAIVRGAAARDKVVRVLG